MQPAQYIKTNKINEVVVLLKKLNEAVVLVKIYSPGGQTKSNKYQTNTNVNNKYYKHESHELLNFAVPHTLTLFSDCKIVLVMLQ